MKWFGLILSIGCTITAMARPCHRCDRHGASCENDPMTIEDLYGFAALFSLAVEAGVEQAIEESGQEPSDDAQAMLEATREFRKLALQEAQETQRDKDVRRIKQRILRAERLLREAEEDLNEVLEEEDASNDLSAEILKALFKEALKSEE